MRSQRSQCISPARRSVNTTHPRSSTPPTPKRGKGIGGSNSLVGLMALPALLEARQPIQIVGVLLDVLLRLLHLDFAYGRNFQRDIEAARFAPCAQPTPPARQGGEIVD